MNKDKYATIFDFGVIDYRDDWHDYLQHGFEQCDVDDLIQLATDANLNQTQDDTVWVPVHAWRALAQLKSTKAIIPLITLFDSADKNEDDWMMNDLPEVMGMIGTDALLPLFAFILDNTHQQSAYLVAASALNQIHKNQPDCRDELLVFYQQYLEQPHHQQKALNGFIVINLLDIKAVELIDEIRQIFTNKCVDLMCAGDLEEVEIKLGVRTQRTTPKPTFEQMSGIKPPNFSNLFDDELNDDEWILTDSFFTRYGRAQSIQNTSELNGFFTAIACAPEMIMPSMWMDAIWGATYAPEWDDIEEFELFNQLIFNHYNQVNQALIEGEYYPLFFKPENDNDNDIVNAWCDGFLRGISLWQALNNDDNAVLGNTLKPIVLFTKTQVLNTLKTLSKTEIKQQQNAITSTVIELFYHFYQKRDSKNPSIVRKTDKIGRNNPCPCGSGKKYKKCCLH